METTRPPEEEPRPAEGSFSAEVLDRFHSEILISYDRGARTMGLADSDTEYFQQPAAEGQPAQWIERTFEGPDDQETDRIVTNPVMIAQLNELSQHDLPLAARTAFEETPWCSFDYDAISIHAKGPYGIEYRYVSSSPPYISVLRNGELIDVSDVRNPDDIELLERKTTQLRAQAIRNGDYNPEDV